MKNFRNILVLVLLLSNFIFLAQKKTTDKKTEPKKVEQKAEELTWYTNLEKAGELSAKTNKPIFAMFTGSDWCGWCKKLQADVFAKPEFIKWANKNVILMEVDFPRGKQLSPEMQQQNNSLQQTFGVRGYPTVWLFYMEKVAATGKYNLSAIGSLGYPQGAELGKEEVKFINDGDQILKNKKN